MGNGSIGGIMMLLWIVVIGALIYMIIKVGSERKYSPAETNAIEVLKERYAKGEISKADFESMKQTLL
ncbi:MAG: SHOCT domain-containing protein [Deltaproteobacteria bacterium]|nr:SHOCT domain-containing protein [Deltaproteobacteria bacterium]MBW1847235.1 SHOCT domain-containing protein [Deltaproteobacteria bacterium]MBW2181357.1 SHOCT domain-containing protein [Deltaproteobacteria bacterium]